MQEMTLKTLRGIKVNSRRISIHLMTLSEAEAYVYQQYCRINEKKERMAALKNLKENLKEIAKDNVYLSINRVSLKGAGKEEKTIGMIVVNRQEEMLVITAISVPNKEKQMEYREDILKQFIKYCKKTNLAQEIKLEEMNGLSNYYKDYYGSHIINVNKVK